MEILELSCAITEKKNSLEGFGGISAQREARFCELKAVDLILSEEQKGKRAKTMEQTQRGSERSSIRGGLHLKKANRYLCRGQI